MTAGEASRSASSPTSAVRPTRTHPPGSLTRLRDRTRQEGDQDRLRIDTIPDLAGEWRFLTFNCVLLTSRPGPTACSAGMRGMDEGAASGSGHP